MLDLDRAAADVYRAVNQGDNVVRHMWSEQDDFGTWFINVIYGVLSSVPTLRTMGRYDSLYRAEYHLVNGEWVCETTQLSHWMED